MMIPGIPSHDWFQVWLLARAGDNLKHSSESRSTQQLEPSFRFPALVWLLGNLKPEAQAPGTAITAAMQQGLSEAMTQ